MSKTDVAANILHFKVWDSTLGQTQSLSNGRGLRRVSSFAAYSQLGEGFRPIDNPQPLTNFA